MSEKALELLDEVRADLEDLKFKEDENLDALRRRAEMIIRNVFAETSKYLKDLEGIHFYPSIWFTNITDADLRPTWDSGKGEFRNLIDTMIEEITLFGPSEGDDKPSSEAERVDALISESVFVVHGHDEEMKQAVARMLEKLGLKAVILHEQPSQGRTVIEKLLDHSADISFAVVLLSPDDLAYEKEQDPTNARYRARQNVVFELGFFLGKLGRSRVVVLHRQADRFEMPSDYSGVLYVPYDDRGTWQFDIHRELKAAGYDVDANVLT